MLNIGGVLGICDSATPDKGKPFDCKVLGTVLTFPYLGERIGVPAKVGYKPLDYGAPLDARSVPVVALAGTCMEAGKTAAASAIISRMRHRGLVVDAFKATGVSLRRDIMAFEDSGARRTMLFTDLGHRHHHRQVRPGADAHHADRNGERAARMPSCSSWATACSGTYGVRVDPARGRTSSQALTAVVLSANDPVAAWGGVKLLRERFGIEPCVVTGPATDNQVGVEIIREQMKVEAFNAISNPGRSRRSCHRARWACATRASRKWSANEREPSPGHRAGRHRLCGRRAAAPDRRPSAAASWRAVLSDSQPGGSVAAAFPHLRSAYPDLRSRAAEDIDAAASGARRARRCSRAAPHGVAGRRSSTDC